MTKAAAMAAKNEYYESTTDDDDVEGKTVTSSLLEMKELNGPCYEGKNFLSIHEE